MNARIQLLQGDITKITADAIALDTVTEFLERSKEVEKVIFVCFDEENYELYDALLGI